MSPEFNFFADNIHNYMYKKNNIRIEKKAKTQKVQCLEVTLLNFSCVDCKW